MALWITVGVIAVVLILAVMLVAFYNNLIKVRNKVDEAFASMDVSLKTRYDLIPNIVNTVKGYAKHESETLEKIVELRNAAMQSKNITDRIKNENELSNSLKTIFALSEAYPQLQANTNFLDLQQQLQKVEEDIANARTKYNSVVKIYNDKIQVFPSNLVAKMLRFKPKQMFEISEQERQNVKVEF